MLLLRRPNLKKEKTGLTSFVWIITSSLFKGFKQKKSFTMTLIMDAFLVLLHFHTSLLLVMNLAQSFMLIKNHIET